VTETKLRVMTDLIDQHLRQATAAGLSANTVTDRGRLLRRVDTDLPMGLESATVEELSDWLARPRWTRQTRATYYGHVRAFFEWATDPNNPHLDWNPAASLTRPKVPQTVPKPVTDDELREALRTAGPWLVPITLAAYAGLRCCELAGIERRDVSEETVMVVGKGDKPRPIPTAGQVWDLVRPLPGGKLIGFDDPRLVSQRAREHFARVGLPGVTMHRFRHWFATTMLANGVDLLTVSKLLGHTSTTTTAVYCLITDGQRRSAICTLPVLTPASC
jgi:integrase